MPISATDGLTRGVIRRTPGISKSMEYISSLFRDHGILDYVPYIFTFLTARGAAETELTASTFF